MTPQAFAFSLERCTGCHACQLACSIENELGDTTSWRRVETHAVDEVPGVRFHLSLACHHCERPACREHCPALAIDRDAATGAVQIDPATCLGCGYCAWACPYDAPLLDRARGVMTKCTFCNDRLHAGLAPACVTGCPTGALRLEERRAPQVEAFLPPGFPRTALVPAIRFVEPRGTLVTPNEPQVPAGRVRLELRREWPLLVFSLLVILLVAWFAGSTPRSPVERGLFAALAVAALGVSTAHLGRPRRAWRALRNLRRSWLSREIALVSAFFVLAIAGAPFAPDLVPWTAALGFVALFAVDRVYDVLTPARRVRCHSADALPTGALLAAVFAQEAWFAALCAAFVAALYLARHARAARSATSWRVVRLLSLGAVPFLVTPWPELAFGVVLGAVLDRCEFYRGA